jgi:hypothetical protein
VGSLVTSLSKKSEIGDSARVSVFQTRKPLNTSETLDFRVYYPRHRIRAQNRIASIGFKCSCQSRSIGV